jgi:DNA-binding transcriptional MerR regulator
MALDNVTVLCYIVTEVNEMENNLISKKELLELTGISYGQLYRWKRKMLIPEDWFIRKSTFTGQETFFPRDKILSRIEKIKNMKDDASLDELADILSPNPSDVEVESERLVKEKIISEASMDIFAQVLGIPEVFDFQKTLYAYLVDKLLGSGDASAEEGKIILKTLAENFPAFEGKQCELLFVRKLGVAFCLLIEGQRQVSLDPGARLVTRLSISSAVEELKTKLSNGGISDGKQ